MAWFVQKEASEIASHAGAETIANNKPNKSWSFHHKGAPPEALEDVAEALAAAEIEETDGK